MSKFKIKKYKGFTMAEMMIVLLVLTIILAASMPIITKRSKSSIDKTWYSSTNGSDVYSALGNTQGVAIGTNEFPASEYAKLLINAGTANNPINHILFSKDGTIVSKLRFSNNQFEFGNNAIATANNSMAIGHTANASTDATAIGYAANASTNNATAIGSASKAGATATSLGYSANATANNSVAIGANTSTGSSSKNNTTVVGYNASASDNNAVAYGANSKASGNESIALGTSSAASEFRAIALGTNATASGNQSIAIGANTTSAEAAGIAIGSNSQALQPYSIAIGYGVVANNQNTIDIGTFYSSSGSTYGTSIINIGSESATVVISGTLNQESDIRKKNILGEYKSGLDDIMKIKTYEFTYKDDLTKTKRIGVIAQELQKIFPNAVKTDSKGYLSIRKEDMFFAVINAIKELNKKYIALKEENEHLKKQIEELSKRLDTLEKRK